MGYFFNGRLWISPATMSSINDNALGNKNLSVGNVLALIGASTGGQPNTALRFGSPSEAAAVLQSGELLDAVKKAFAPSAQIGAPATVVAIRVNPATQATLALNNASAAAVINLTSTDYGAYTNQIKVKVAAGTTTGLQLTAQLGANYYTQDNVARNAFSIQYSGGQATARMSITATQLTLEAPNA